uniref:Uncharacterized protein n=1 Tax=Bos mutus grunniens TaxID=30521 RepID=A0A8B9XR79_BOSMU
MGQGWWASRAVPATGSLIQSGGQVRRHRQGAHNAANAADGWPDGHVQPHGHSLRGLRRLRTGSGSTPPGITAPAVPSIPSPIGVNGFTGLPPQANGQPAAEAVFANGIHPYPAQSPTAADPLQQAYAGVQQYAGR